MNNRPIALDFNDLAAYDRKIKDYIEEKSAKIISEIPDTYNKEEIDSKIENAYKADLVEIDRRIDAISETVSAHTQNLTDLKDHIDENEAAILILQDDDKQIREDIADIRVALESKADRSDIPSIEGLATEEYVRKKIAEAELSGSDIDLSDYAKLSDIDALNKRVDDQNDALAAIHTEIDNVQNNLEQYITESELAARNYATLDKLESYATKDYVGEVISNIPQPDLSDYATKTELEAVQRVAGENSVKLFAVESELFDINKKLETIPDTSEFITMKDVEAKGYATEQYVLDHVNIQIETEVETQVTEVVEKQVTEVVQTQVKDEVTEQLAKNEKINYGTFGEV